VAAVDPVQVKEDLVGKVEMHIVDEISELQVLTSSLSSLVCRLHIS